jgi:hypothetical protein
MLQDCSAALMVQEDVVPTLSPTQTTTSTTQEPTTPAPQATDGSDKVHFLNRNTHGFMKLKGKQFHIANCITALMSTSTPVQASQINDNSDTVLFSHRRIHDFSLLKDIHVHVPVSFNLADCIAAPIQTQMPQINDSRNTVHFPNVTLSKTHG